MPAFNPDDDENPPPSVRAFRALLDAADGVLISSPEYAHGIAGALKNALDWVVGSSEFVDKPVALINASPRATIAQASLTEILKTMSAVVVEDASIAMPLLGRNLAADAIMADAELGPPLRDAIATLAAAAERVRAAAD